MCLCIYCFCMLAQCTFPLHGHFVVSICIHHQAHLFNTMQSNILLEATPLDDTLYIGQLLQQSTTGTNSSAKNHGRVRK